MALWGAVLLATVAQPVDWYDRPTSAALAILTPGSAPSQSRTSAILSAAAYEFERQTDLQVLSADRVGLSEDAMLSCPAARRVSCWAGLIQDQSIGFLLVLTLAPADGEDVLSGLWIDLDRARTVDATAADLERQIYRHTQELLPRPAEPLAELFREVVETLRPSLDRSGHFRPYGTLVVDADCEGCVLEIGDLSIPVTEQAIVVSGVRAGTHLVTARGAEGPCERSTVVSANQRQTLELDCAPPVDGSRLGWWLGGSGVALAGAGLLTAAITIRSNQDVEVCLERQTGACMLPNDGVALAAIGSGLLAGGLSALVSTWLLSEDARWWGLLVAGAVAAGAFAGTWLAL